MGSSIVDILAHQFRDIYFEIPGSLAYCKLFCQCNKLLFLFKIFKDIILSVCNLYFIHFFVLLLMISSYYLIISVASNFFTLLAFSSRSSFPCFFPSVSEISSSFFTSSLLFLVFLAEPRKITLL